MKEEKLYTTPRLDRLMSVDRFRSRPRDWSGLVQVGRVDGWVGEWVFGVSLEEKKRNILSRAQLDGEGVSDNSKFFFLKDMS